MFKTSMVEMDNSDSLIRLKKESEVFQKILSRIIAPKRQSSIDGFEGFIGMYDVC